MKPVTTTLVTTLALALSATALAATPRHEATEPGCFGKPRPKAMDNFKGKLDEGKVRVGLDGLRSNGDEGCKVIVDWLASGAPGGNEDQVETVVTWIGRSDAEGTWEQVLALAAHDNEDIRDEALEVMEERLVELSADEVALLVGSPHEDVRYAAVGILAGHHAVVEVTSQSTAGGFGPTIIAPEEVEFYGADRVPPAHEQGLKQLLSDRSADVRERLAEVIGRMMWEGLGTAPSYPSMLLTLAGDPEPDVVEEVAVATARGAPDNGVEIVEALLASGNEDALEELVDWLDEAVDDKRFSDNLLAILETMAADGPDEHRGTCDKMAKKVAKKLGR